MDAARICSSWINRYKEEGVDGVKILSLDASTKSTGWAVFDGEQLVAHGVIKEKHDDWRENVMAETMELAAIIREYRPDSVYAEDVPMKDGKLTIAKLGAVQGMILSLCAGFRLKPTFLLPTVWRCELGMFDGTRKGMTRDVLKEKAVRMANEIFGLDLVWVKPKSIKNMDDTAEAILIGWSQIKKRGGTDGDL